jgi:adenine-specific DNA methylase
MMNKNLESLYKPIQYLGAKTRTLDVIVSECFRLYEKESYVVDLFSGSSLVAQALYHNKMSVIANDVMRFCSDMSTCLLNIAKTNDSVSLLKKAINDVSTCQIDSEFIEPFKDYIDNEESLIKTKDLYGLKELYSRLPIMSNETIEPSSQVKYISEHIGKEAFNGAPLITNYYSGSYFGIMQSIRLDAIRCYIEKNFIENGDFWMHTALLTALYSTLSTIVHSAGKHFAQPISITDIDKNKITNIRLFENRSYDVDLLFVGFLKEILAKTGKLKTLQPCVSTCNNVQDKCFANLLEDKNISVIYADPPYTAQQYSRFYHIPEVVRFYKYPQLQQHRGHITQGLYPEGKFKSDFCSKTKAKDAFRTVFGLVKKAQCSFVLSYSESKKDATGNERMVSRNDILSIAEEFIPNHKLKQLRFDFDYRQLNSSANVVHDKEDKEFLIIFEK